MTYGASEHSASSHTDPLILVTLSGRVVSANQAARDLLQLPGEPFTEHNLFELTEDDREAVVALLLRSTQTPERASATLTWRCNGVACRRNVEGLLWNPSRGDEEPTVLLRLRSADDAATTEPRVGSLNNRINALSRDDLLPGQTDQNPRSDWEWLRITLATIGEAVIAVDCGGRIAFMNAAAERMTGWKQDEAMGEALTRVCRIVDERTGDVIENPCERVLRSDDASSLSKHVLLIARDGREQPIEDTVAPIRNAQGELQGVVLAFRDLSERRRAASALAASEDRLRYILEAAGVGTWEWDIASNAVAWSPNLEEIHGHTRGSFDGTFEGFLKGVHPGDRDRVVRAIHNAIEQDGVYEIEYRNIRGDGSESWIAGKGRVIYDDANHPVRMIGVCFDITRRKEAEQKVHSQREWLSTTLASIGDAVIATDERGRITFMNPMAESLTGWRYTEALDRDSSEVFHIVDERTREATISPVLQVLREGNVVAGSQHTLLIARDGSERSIDESGAPIHDSANRVIGSVLVFRDITERREVERELRDSEERMRAVVETAVDGIITISERGVVESLNPAAERLFGYRRDEVIGRNISMLMPSPYREEHDRYLSNYRATGMPHIIGTGREVVGKRKDGSTFPLELTVSEVKLRDRRVFTGVVRDVTERVRAEQALRESEGRFRLMADAAPVLIWVADTTMACTYFNRVWLDFTGRTLEQEIGNGWRQGVHPDDLPMVLDYGKVFDRRESFRFEYRLRNAAGEYRWMLVTGVPRFEADGTFAGYIGSCVDITDRKQHEEELRKVNESLEERVRERTAVAERRAAQLRALAFDLTQAEQRERRRLAQILHEHLQQLLVATKMRVGALAKESGGDAHREELARIRDLLTQSIETSRSLTVELSPPVLYDGGLAAALHWLARRMKEKHDVDIELDIQTQTEPTFEDVKVILFDAVRELIFNAIKHARVERVYVVMQGDNRQLRLTVRDNGVGFDPRILERHDRKTENFGLFNIRERLDVLGGTFEVESQRGRGTRVTVAVPNEPLQAGGVGLGRTASPRDGVMTSTLESSSAMSPDVIRVLLADDHKILREGVRGLLQSSPDIEVVGEASDGRMAVELTRRLRPNVVVMDVTMPNMNGIEATRRIKEEFPQVRVVALSMHEPQDMAVAMRDAGAQTYLAKDGPSEDLIRAIRGQS